MAATPPAARRRHPSSASGEDDVDNGSDGTTTTNNNNSHNNNNSAGDDDEVEILSDAELTARARRLRLTDLGGGGSVWEVSTAKHSNGVRHLRSPDLSRDGAYWQSDGTLPHTLRVDLQRLAELVLVAVYLDHARDESYTPRAMRLLAGTVAADTAQVAVAEVEKPCGWVLLRAAPPAATATAASAVAANGAAASPLATHEQQLQQAAATVPGLWCTRVELQFTENHQNGRDCHVRGVRLLGRGGGGGSSLGLGAAYEVPRWPEDDWALR